MHTLSLFEGQQAKGYTCFRGHTSAPHIQVTLLMLKNRETVMGRIDSSNVVVDGQMDSKKGVTSGAGCCCVARSTHFGQSAPAVAMRVAQTKIL